MYFLMLSIHLTSHLKRFRMNKDKLASFTSQVLWTFHQYNVLRDLRQSPGQGFEGLSVEGGGGGGGRFLPATPGGREHCWHCWSRKRFPRIEASRGWEPHSPGRARTWLLRADLVPGRRSDGGDEDLREDLALQVVQRQGGSQGVAGCWCGGRPETAPVGVPRGGGCRGGIGPEHPGGWQTAQHR